MALEVVDSHQRQIERQRHRLAKRQPDHDTRRPAPAPPSRRFRPGPAPPDRRRSEPAPRWRRWLRTWARAAISGTTPAVGRMFGDLTQHHRRCHLDAATAQAHHGRGRLVATGLDTQDGHGGGWGVHNWPRRCREGPVGVAHRAMTMQPILIGTRGSRLALAQADTIRVRIAQALGGDHMARLEVITTSGDRIQDRTLTEIGGKGLFTLEIEQALLSGRIQCAIPFAEGYAGGRPTGADPRGDSGTRRPARRLSERRPPDTRRTSARRAPRHRQPAGARRSVLHDRARSRCRQPARQCRTPGSAKMAAGEADAILLAMAGLNPPRPRPSRQRRHRSTGEPARAGAGRACHPDPRRRLRRALAHRDQAPRNDTGPLPPNAALWSRWRVRARPPSGPMPHLTKIA